VDLRRIIYDERCCPIVQQTQIDPVLSDFVILALQLAALEEIGRGDADQ
jgi:hypothetical protein